MLRVFAGREGQALSLLGYALYEVYGLTAVPAVARREKGKPWFPDRPEIRFNISHSGPLALCAVGSGEVGADIEEVRPRGGGLPRFALNDAEFEEYLEQGGSWEVFYTLWTRKEAWCKYTGQGVSSRPSRMAVANGLFLRSDGGEGWRCAVCAAEPPPEPEWVAGYGTIIQQIQGGDNGMKTDSYHTGRNKNG